MDKVDFTFKRGGRTKPLPERQAKLLQRIGIGTYQTRDMARQPMQTKPMLAAPVESVSVPAVSESVVDDGLGALDKDQLHALAKERGVRVHHLAGADRVRAALREQ